MKQNDEEPPVESYPPSTASSQDNQISEAQSNEFVDEQNVAPLPIGSKALIILNCLVFGLMVITSGFGSFMDPSIKTLIAWGGDFGPLTFNDQYWRIVTSCFVHSGILHIGMNMVVLQWIARGSEGAFGTPKFLFIYLCAGIGGSLTSLLFHPQTVSVGASGAVFGAFGAFLVYFKKHGQAFDTAYVKATTKSVATLFVLNIILGMAKPGTDNAAHIGGFVFGALAGAAVLPPNVWQRNWSAKDTFWAIIVALMQLGMFYFELQTFDQAH